MCGDNYEHSAAAAVAAAAAAVAAAAAAVAAAGLVVLEHAGDAVAADEESDRCERVVVSRVVDDWARSLDHSRDWQDRKRLDYRCRMVLGFDDLRWRCKRRRDCFEMLDVMTIPHWLRSIAAVVADCRRLRIACETCFLLVYQSYRLLDDNYDARRLRSPLTRLTFWTGSDDGRCENEAVRQLRDKRHCVE